MKIICLLIAFVSILYSAFSQSCLPEGILFSTQSQIDSFQIYYPGCTSIEGDVQILGEDISDLEGLGVLDSILGNFTIGHYWNAGNPELENLNGLENLSFIGGGLYIQHNVSLINMEGLSGLNHIGNSIEIEGNILINFSGLEGIDTIHANLYINGNDQIEDLTGLNNIKCIQGRLLLFDNENLHNLTGLNNLNIIGVGMDIESNDHLTSLTGLDNLHAAGFLLLSGNNLTSLIGLDNLDTLYDGISINYSNALTSLDGLSSLDYIGGGINLEGNSFLESLEGLSALTYLGGEIRLLWNSSLTSLSGLENIDPGSIGNIWIGLNQNLSECDGASFCAYLASPNGSVSIFENAIGCNNPHEIADQCGITLPCLPYGNYHFTSQADVDSFPNYYPGCSNLQGEVYIESNDIVNLENLAGIDTISGSLYICGNQNLASLMGLHNLKIITGDLNLGYWEHGSNPALIDLTGLNSLSSVGDYMMVLGNSGLTSFSGLDSLAMIGQRFEIIDNPSLKNLAGLDNLKSMRSIMINSNDSLLNLDGLQNLAIVDEYVEVKNNPMLLTLNGIENIVADSLDVLSIQNNASLSVCNVKSVCDYLGIPENHVYIENNVAGCNSPEEVAAACGVGVDEVHQQKGTFLIYPNPATKEIYIETSENQGKVEVSILNLNGQAIINQTFFGRKTVIGIGNLPGGIYLVRLKGEKGVAVQKLVK